MKFILTTIILVLCSQAHGQLILNVRTPPEPPIKAEKPEPQKIEYEKLIVYAYSPAGFRCPQCEVAKSWDADSLPFEIVWRKSNIHKQYPAFTFPRRDSKNWRIVYGANKDFLIEQWTLHAETDNETYRAKTNPKPETMLVDLSPEEPELRKVTCGCRGSTPGCCLCLQEIRAGRRTKPCTCSRSKGSVHLVRGEPPNRESIKATGEYSKLSAARQRAYCPQCRRKH